MNQLTTIASLPSGSGAKSALPAEVGRAPEPKQASGFDYSWRSVLCVPTCEGSPFDGAESIDHGFADALAAVHTRASPYTRIDMVPGRAWVATQDGTLPKTDDDPKYACGGYVGNAPVANTDSAEREASQSGKPTITMNFTIGDVASASMVKRALAAFAARAEVPINDEYVAPLGSQKAISTDKLDEETLARIERIRKSLGWC